LKKGGQTVPAKRAKKGKIKGESKLPALPKLLSRKIYKTGQTRGADDDDIYQNRVLRNNTVLIPYAQWKGCKRPAEGKEYENAAIVLVDPITYFDTPDADSVLEDQGLELGKNALVFYEKRSDWVAHDPSKLGWRAATKRKGGLGGKYVARISATTKKGVGRVVHGFTTTKDKGAGIRVYEYADAETISKCGLQLEALFWLCRDSVKSAVAGGMTEENATKRRAEVISRSGSAGLLDIQKLRSARVINQGSNTICPLCLAELPGMGFLTREAQAAGREVHDLTITQVNLFHIEELRHAVWNHKPYNVGWGHHHCNVVVRDAGIQPTLSWMRDVVCRNDKYDDDLARGGE
jgi:hypothetical protein